MPFVTILETIFISPLKLIFEFIFQIANSYVGNPGVSIIALSLLMNILVLPLYMRADVMQEEARDIDNKLSKGVTHIKKVFSGDEKMMILQTYYRQNNYKPTDALKGSVSLLLEIPFFMAAYQFLSNLDVLSGTSFGPIKDLGAPDGILVIGGIAINILPILMTLINVVSSAIYLKGFPLKTKIQLYGMAVFFLVFLYTSPSGLVFYWTLNNLFSLVKSIFYKLNNPKKALRILFSVVGVIAIIGAFAFSSQSIKRRIIIIAVGALLQLPLILPLLPLEKLKSKESRKKTETTYNKKIFIAGSVFLTILIGLFIPSIYISASPQEYVDVSFFYNPLWFIVSSLCLSIGTFLVWLRVFYWLATPKIKVLFDRTVWILSGVMLINYMFFGTDLGIISSTLQYENGVIFSSKEIILNLLVITLASILLYFISFKWQKVVTGVLLTAIIALGGMSVVNMITIKTSVDKISVTANVEKPHFQLSKTGKNVVVLMLDRAMGEYVPYIFNEKPELKTKFDGFTYYSNTISFGAHTNFGVPAMLGGYEYTPVEFNKRDEETLLEKHNEALKVMPVLFNNNNYEVTVCDPPYANYEWIPDLSIYDEYSEINTYNTKGVFNDKEQFEQVVKNNNRNFFCFSIMKSMPVIIQPRLYSEGTYNMAYTKGYINYSGQKTEGTSIANGYNKGFLDGYNVLLNMPEITQITDDSKNTFFFMDNHTAHETMLLKEPEYVPSVNLDNTEYDVANSQRFSYNGNNLIIETDQQMAHYQSNMAAFLQVGNWLDYLRENGVYDNTRIILVSDHGFTLYHNDDLVLDDATDRHKNAEFYYPLLMVKDFNAEGFSVSDEFMTNADVPTLATKNLIDNPKNPFTGKVINNNDKYEHEQLVILSDKWEVSTNNGYTYLPSKWASVKDNMWDKNNWIIFDEEVVLKEHKLP